MESKKLPSFKKPTHTTAFDTPEAMFGALTRASTHGYLRGQQQDVLRDYAAGGTKAPDVAFELPTGTGKTAVGLLVAEWKRRAGHKAAYLCLTNQLAGQVLGEAAKLGVPAADLRGAKYSRDPAEEGKFRTGAAVAITTYSNLFNTKPIIRDCGLVVFDDAHGGEHYVSDMWSVSVDAATHPGPYSALVAALRPALSPAQFTEVTESKDYPTVQIADVVGHPECLPAVRDILEDEKDFSYEWRLISAKLHACVFLLSSSEVYIRPVVPPTHSHAPFVSIGQRVYLSATLGGRSDLERAYGVRKVEVFRAKSAQWGKRYIFVPGLYTDEQGAFNIAGKIWDQLPQRRAVLLGPSAVSVTKAFGKFEVSCSTKPTRLGADSIADDLAPFTKSTDVVLALAGRYDGLDLRIRLVRRLCLPVA